MQEDTVVTDVFASRMPLYKEYQVKTPVESANIFLSVFKMLKFESML